jgi:hypothetical protein
MLLAAKQDNPVERLYRLELIGWDNQSRNLGSFRSSCRPELSSLAPDLAFLVSCREVSQVKDYRVLRTDGRPVLKGQSLLNELGHAAIGNEATRSFAVKIVQASQPLLPGQVFQTTDLESMDFSLYQAEDGKHLFSVRVSDPPASSGGFALAPDGKHLAVLTRSRIAFYLIPVN